MGDRACKYCGKTFRYPAHLRRHQDSKRKCVPAFAGADGEDQTKTSICRFCGKRFTEETNLHRHIRTACKIAPNEKNGTAGMERLYDLVTEQRAEDRARIAALEAQNAEILGLMRQMAAQVAAPGGQSYPNSGNQAGEVAIQGDHATVNQDRRVYNINIFGRESLDHITAERIKTILDDSLKRPSLPAAANTAVVETAMLVYSDPERPENLTCYLPNKKMNEALVHASREDGTTGWEVRPTSLVLPPMAQKSVDTLFDRQPFENAEEYGPLMQELRENEARYTSGGEMRPILVRNKDLLARALESLPVVGAP